MSARRRARELVRRTPWLLVAVGSAATAVVLTAAIAVAGASPGAVALAGLGLLGAAGTATAWARVSDARSVGVQRELTTLRLATGAVARDADAISRAARRLDESTRRSVAAVLGHAAADGPDGAALVTISVLGASRELHFVGEESAFERYRTAVAPLGRDVTLSFVPPGAEAAYLDRRAARRRGKVPSLPTFVVDDAAALRRLVTGDLADLVAAVLGTPEYVVILPPSLRPAALRATGGVEVTALADPVVLVHRLLAPPTGDTS